MAINLATLTPASTKAKNVATEDYVDTSTDAFATSIYYPNTTEIDGGKIRTNTINADRIIAGTSMSAPLINGGTINGGTINGGTINGVNITGSVIKSSWIDYTSNGSLSNWQYFTPATIPSEYEANFAKDNTTGELVVDSLGYVRLPAVFNVYTSAINYSEWLSVAQYYTLTSRTWNVTDGLASWDSYAINSSTRTVTKNPRLTLAQSTTILSLKGGGSYVSRLRCYIVDTLVEIRISNALGELWVNGARVVYVSSKSQAYWTVPVVYSHNFTIHGIGLTVTFSGEDMIVLNLNVSPSIALSNFDGSTRVGVFRNFSGTFYGDAYYRISVPSLMYT